MSDVELPEQLDQIKMSDVDLPKQHHPALAAFFNSYHQTNNEYIYDPAMEPVAEFGRLCTARGWLSGKTSTKKSRRAKREFDLALKAAAYHNESAHVEPTVQEAQPPRSPIGAAIPQNECNAATPSSSKSNSKISPPPLLAVSSPYVIQIGVWFTVGR